MMNLDQRFFRKALVFVVVLLLVSLLLAGCSALSGSAPVVSVPSATFTPFQPIAPSPTYFPPSTQGLFPAPADLTPTPTPGDLPTAPAAPPEPAPSESNSEGDLMIWAAPYLPEKLRQSLSLPAGAGLTALPEESQLRLEFGSEQPVSRWVYAVAAPFPTIPGSVQVQDLVSVWQGQAAGPFAGRPLLVDESTREVFSQQWGPPDPNYVRVVPADRMLDEAWSAQPSWALIPFEKLEPRWKVLEVDGQSPIFKEFLLDNYPLAVPFSFHSDVFSADTLAQAVQALNLPASNRDPNRLTTLAMTGVTAMVRCTAATMEQRGLTYPAAEIGGLLREADLAHISNEIPFSPDCSYPSCTQPGLVFCSAPRYIELMEDIGTDIVELTGDHFADWGAEAMYYTLEMYRERGWPYYGGGENREEALRPLLIEHNGNRLAFIGCNAKALVGYATASETQPGAVRCDWDYMQAEIARLRADGYIPIATFQHEEYYRYTAAPNLQVDFRGVAAAGAFIVSGSQAHQPHGMEFFNGSFLHYGLGNLFFDQFGYCPDDACAQAFIDRHIFYDNRYISTELIPLQFVNYAQSRFMTAAEKTRFLEIIFSASNWD